jgi:thioredoxin 1
MKASNALIVVAVVVVVGGVAWLRSARERSSIGAAPPGATSAVANPRNEPATAPAKAGDLCPDPPPVARPADAPATAPASPAATQAVAKKLPRVVDLGADKCKACKDLAPILEQLRQEYAGRVVVEFIDVWKNPKAGEPYKIRVIPTQVFFDANGKEIWRHEGFLPKADFIAKFAELGVK